MIISGVGIFNSASLILISCLPSRKNSSS